MGLYSRERIYEMLIALHIWGTYIQGASIQGGGWVLVNEILRYTSPELHRLTPNTFVLNFPELFVLCFP